MDLKLLGIDFPVQATLIRGMVLQFSEILLSKKLISLVESSTNNLPEYATELSVLKSV